MELIHDITGFMFTLLLECIGGTEGLETSTSSVISTARALFFNKRLLL